MEEALLLLGGFVLFVVLFIAVIGLILYILSSLGLMKIASNNGTKGAWMAWFPIFSVYLMGKLAFNKLIGWALVILAFLNSATTLKVVDGNIVSKTLLPELFAQIASLSFAILLLVVLYKIYNKVSDKAVVMMIFTILTFGLLSPVFLFAIRKNDIRA